MHRNNFNFRFRNHSSLLFDVYFMLKNVKRVITSHSCLKYGRLFSLEHWIQTKRRGRFQLGSVYYLSRKMRCKDSILPLYFLKQTTYLSPQAQRVGCILFVVDLFNNACAFSSKFFFLLLWVHVIRIAPTRLNGH
jgi:hypothetical protein